MTLIHAPWAVDGARSTSALARVSTYATGGGRSGIVRPGDLKVLPLAVPGNGLRITSGASVILNGYQADPREAYAIANNGTHTVLAGDMPAPVPQVAHYLVCIVVGDPEFNQAGHPFMPPAILPEDAADYEYVRVVVVPCNAGTTRFEQLGLNYPAYALARLEIPANTSTITDAMITDLREVSAPRQERHLLSAQTTSANSLASGDMVKFVTYEPTVEIPAWATKMLVTADITGIFHQNPDCSGHLAIRSSADGSEGPWATYQCEVTGNPSGVDALAAQSAWVADVSQVAGQMTTLSLWGRRAGGQGHIRAGATVAYGTMITFDVQFVEAVR